MNIQVLQKTNIPCSTEVGRLNESNLTHEYTYYSSLVTKRDRTNTGAVSFTSQTSLLSYNVASGGETAMMNYLFSLYGTPTGWMLGADDINALSDNDQELSLNKAGKAIYSAVLPSDGWSGSTQTITVTGIALNDAILVAPRTSSLAVFSESGITATARTTNSITFSCTAVPQVAVNIIILDLGTTTALNDADSIINVATKTALPSQTDNAGKSLTTNGTTISWGEMLPVNSTATDPTGTTRKNFEGYFYATRVYGGVFNDYAEYRASDLKYEPGCVVQEGGQGKLSLCLKKYCQMAYIVSDVYGMAIGSSKNTKCEVPVAVAGRVLVTVDMPCRVGDYICSNNNGVATVMSKWQALLHPHSILGIVVEVPTYKEWNGIKVKNRVWVKVVT